MTSPNYGGHSFVRLWSIYNWRHSKREGCVVDFVTPRHKAYTIGVWQKGKTIVKICVTSFMNGPSDGTQTQKLVTWTLPWLETRIRSLSSRKHPEQQILKSFLHLSRTLPESRSRTRISSMNFEFPLSKGFTILEPFTATLPHLKKTGDSYFYPKRTIQN